MLEELPPELPEVELDGLEELGLELMPLEELVPPFEELVPPLEELVPFDWAAFHSERLICPSWFLSILSNSALEALDEVPPAADELPFDDLLLCDMEGDELEPFVDDEVPSAYADAAKASSEKLRNRGLTNFMQISPKSGPIGCAPDSALRPARGAKPFAPPT